MKNKVYLAGPDVFKRNAIELGKKYVQLAKERGLVGLYPLDNVVDMNQEKPDLAIFKLNHQLLDSADYVVANLNCFRGNEPDSGTVWEGAYAFAKGKIVVGYIIDGSPMLDRLCELTDGKVYDYEHGHEDENQMHIENFGNPLNLMLQHSFHIVIGDISTALDKVKEFMHEKSL